MDDANKRLKAARRLIRQGEQAKARHVLKPVIEQAPTAEAWFVLAVAMETREKAIRCLKASLEIDAWYAPANRMLSELQEVESLPETNANVINDQLLLSDLVSDLDDVPDAPLSYERITRRSRRRFGCVYGLLLISSITSLLTLSLLGVVPGGITLITLLRGGPQPVTQINQTPIANVPDAALLIEPAMQKQSDADNVEIIDHGYVHEYSFDAVVGDEFEGYVQFLSFEASNVQQNVVIVDPDGERVPESVCFFRGDSGLLNGDSSANFNCQINMDGTWRVRVLGIRGQSIGTYFLRVERLSG